MTHWNGTLQKKKYGTVRVTNSDALLYHLKSCDFTWLFNICLVALHKNCLNNQKNWNFFSKLIWFLNSFGKFENKIIFPNSFYYNFAISQPNSANDNPTKLNSTQRPWPSMSVLTKISVLANMSLLTNKSVVTKIKSPNWINRF